MVNNFFSFSSKKHYYFILISCLLLFFPLLGYTRLFDWDEINFAESAREMLVTGNYSQVQVNFFPFWEKPPLFFWLQALSMKIFGVNEFAARFPNAVIGVLTILFIYYIAKQIESKKFALTAVLIHLGTILPHMYFKSGIIDPVFNFFIFCSVFFLYKFFKYGQLKYHYTLLTGVALGLAVTTKGPVAIILVVITYFIYVLLTKNWITLKGFLWVFFSTFFTTLLWYGVEIWNHGWWFFNKFIAFHWSLLTSPVAGHGQPFYYHPVVIFFGCFPASLFGIAYFFTKKRKEDDFYTIMALLFWVVLIIFSVVTTKIIHYSSMTYIPLTFLATKFIYHYYPKKIRLVNILYYFIGLTIGLGTILFLLFAYFRENFSHLIKDEFVQSILSKPVHFSYWEVVIGVLFCVFVFWNGFYLRKKKIKQFVFFNFVNISIFLFLIHVFVLNKIESFSQGTHADFYKEIKNKNVYLMPYGFRSYVPSFYFPQTKPNYPVGYDSITSWLLYGDIDKPAYFITNKKRTTEELLKIEDIKHIRTEYGFGFFVRPLKIKK